MQRLIIYQLNFSKFILRLCFPSSPTNKINKTNNPEAPLHWENCLNKWRDCILTLHHLISSFNEIIDVFTLLNHFCLKSHHVTDSGGDDVFVVTFVDLLAAFEVLSDKSLPSPDLRRCEVEKLFIDESRPRGCAPGHSVLHSHSARRQLGCEQEDNQRKTTVKSLF